MSALANRKEGARFALTHRLSSGILFPQSGAAERSKEMPEENRDAPKRVNLCGKQIRRLRIAQGLTLAQMQATLASEYGLDVDRTNLGRLEQGTRKISDVEVVIFADLFHLSPEQLFWGKSIPDKSQLCELLRTLTNATRTR